MTDADYEKLVESSAREYKEEEYSAYWRSPEYHSHVITDFEAGVKWSRTHPPPEVLELIETFENGLGGWMSAALSDSHVCVEMKSDINSFLDALARFKERTAGDEGEG